MDITEQIIEESLINPEQIIEESLINPCNVFIGKRGGGLEEISEPSVGAICNVFLVSNTL